MLLVLTLAIPGLNAAWTAVLLTSVVVIALGLVVCAFWKARQERRAFEQRIEEWAGERASQKERLRIARDLHDLASHGLGLMTVRAATANLTADDDDAERRTALADIERLGREATAELRRMLTVLRGPAFSPAPLRPADTLDSLPAIIDAVSHAGLTTTLEVGDVGEIAAGVQLTACAIVRESLNNALRYAGPTTATVRINRTGETITVDVQDAGPQGDWQPYPGAGHGLEGLGERIALHGGTLAAGRHNSGFRILAELPASGGN